MAHLIIFLIRLYQCTLSPDHGWLRIFHPFGYCRFFPSCSEYSKQAVEVHGVIKGLFLSTARVCRCHPYGAKGFDPVPHAYNYQKFYEYPRN